MSVTNKNDNPANGIYGDSLCFLGEYVRLKTFLSLFVTIVMAHPFAGQVRTDRFMRSDFYPLELLPEIQPAFADGFAIGVLDLAGEVDVT